MFLQNNTKNMSDDEKVFCQTVKQMLNKSHKTFPSKNHKCQIIIEIYTFMSLVQFWTYEPRYKKFVQTVRTKGYEILKDINIPEIEPETKQKTQKAIHTVLRLICCNKMVKGRYCKRKKIGQYCTFHTGIKNQISKCMTEATESYVIKDIANIITDYISL